LGGWIATGELWPHLLTTLGEAVGGYMIGAVLGIVAGFMLGLNPFLARTVSPVITAVYAVPKVSFAPLLIMAFGLHEASKVALTTLIVFFFVFFDTYRGARSVSSELRDVVAVMGASRWQMVRLVVWPTAIEWVIDGLKISVPYAFIGAVAGEIMMSNRGLGFLIREHASNLDVNGIFAALMVLLVFAAIANHLVDRARRGAARWRGEMI
jgi:NitT/TauT family transport system permease protein